MIRFLRSVPILDEACTYWFPSLEGASVEGIVCAGGNLSPGILLSAYRQGIFPWYGDGEPILWWSPEPRFTVLPETLHVSESSEKLLRRHPFSLTIDQAFGKVIASCAYIPRRGQDGTWIVPDMIEAYNKLHELGFAHSVEVWDDDTLVGGLYGIGLGSAFFGESMFSAKSGASRVGFLCFAMALFENGFELIDSQVYTDYLGSMGGVELPRNTYLRRLGCALRMADKRGRWDAVFPDFPASEALSRIMRPGKKTISRGET